MIAAPAPDQPDARRQSVGAENTPNPPQPIRGGREIPQCTKRNSHVRVIPTTDEPGRCGPRSARPDRPAMAVDLVHGGTEPASGPGVQASSHSIANSDPRLASLSTGAAIVTASVAALVIVGWIVDNDVLKAAIPGLG